MEDLAVRERLWECLDLSAELGISGIILHSNMVRPVGDWSPERVERSREKLREFSVELRRRLRGGPIWVGLENMPIMGNFAKEMDPTLVFPADFDGLCGDELGITWDLCHYSYSVYVAEQLGSGHLEEGDLYPALRDQGLEDFVELADHIVHWHFSAFRGLARVRGEGRCYEGQAPWASTLGESTYARLFARMQTLPGVAQVTFEIAEHDYRERVNTHAVMRWCRERMPPAYAGQS